MIEVNELKIKDLGIDTYKENVIFMRYDCPICRSEGFSALTRLMVTSKNCTIVATLNVIYTDLLQHDEAGLSTEAIKRLNINEGDVVNIHHLQTVQSFSFVRGKIFGKAFNEDQLAAIMKDIVAGCYSNVELASFITACSAGNLSLNEVTFLTKAMISSGKKLSWNKPIVLDKHCIGGLPGNRTTPIVVSIIAAAGYLIPKTSSRAITSPAGTADTMEVITNVNLDIAKIEDVVKKEMGCFAWGGAIKLSPADDIIISVEKALDLDSEGQIIASVLSKKAAAGSTHVLIDIPVGETAKVRNLESANRLEYLFKTVGDAIGLNVQTIISDGSQPVGVGIGPALEAMDVLSVLQNKNDLPIDLKERAVLLAQSLLNMVQPEINAMEILESGVAFEKFKSICLAQGEWKEPVFARYSYEHTAAEAGKIIKVNNRQLAKLAKLCGAPKSPAAGIQFYAPLNKIVGIGDTLLTIWAETPGELTYAKEYLNTIPELIIIN